MTMMLRRCEGSVRLLSDLGADHGAACVGGPTCELAQSAPAPGSNASVANDRTGYGYDTASFAPAGARPVSDAIFANPPKIRPRYEGESRVSGVIERQALRVAAATFRSLSVRRSRC